ncbi:glycosyltransferase family 4 protein [Adlercreutzia sp. ZJ138]|uniref:glycosyltransferase family 4 protein n=1 Tax=Adlercreutzia sp. ZJ138 TaxID=2709405 RepID=UPI0013EA3C9B|nr:glycosyltransferase family 4 protein [Adlercreutzia sp. ZJ138]
MTKIAVITAATNTIPRFRIDMIDEFVHRGCEVVVFGDEPEEEWVEYFSSHEVGYRRYRVSRNGTNPIADIKTQYELRSLLRSERPDKVFTYQAKPNIYGTLAARSAGIEEVYVMMGGLGSVFHADDTKSRAVRKVVSMQYRRAFKNVRSAFFQNSEDVKLFEDLGIVDHAKVVMVRGSGVNLGKYPMRPLPAKTSFLFVGRLVRGKGVFDYLEAARVVKSIHPEVSFHLVGPFDTNPTALKPEELRQYINDGTVEYEGEKRPSEVQPFLERCSCFVLPSYYGEGTPKSALEAMATGRPLIVADAVGCREVVRDGENGFFVPPRDPEVIAEAMTRLIDDSTLAERMGETSRCMAEELFDVRKVNDVICKTMGIKN